MGIKRSDFFVDYMKGVEMLDRLVSIMDEGARGEVVVRMSSWNLQVSVGGSDLGIVGQGAES
jgi:hypothetical protein